MHQQQQQAFHGANHGSGQQTGSPPWGAPFPSLHLWPIQDTFQFKMVHLPPGQKVKIGRQTNNKTVPGERNAYFDSKVLSRTHAEIWEQGGKIFIQDVKSSNGTFINGIRLSPEGVESEPCELKSEDLVEFGIDIISEDNRTIIHHKVSAKVYCVLGQEDAAASARELAHYQNDPRAPPAMNSSGHMGPSIMSAGGKANGLSFEHVLQKLQNELNKSKETGQELQGLTTNMTDVQDTLGGGLPPSQNGSAAQYIPAQFWNPSAEARAALAGPHGPQAAAYFALQAQMTETQSSVSTHLDKIRQLETQIKQQDALKNEIAAVRQQMEDSKREMEQLLASAQLRHNTGSYDPDDDDDARSVATVMPGDDETSDHSSPKAEPNGSDMATDTDLAARIQALSTEMADALQLSKALQTQHGEAMAAVKTLTERVGVLENDISDRVASAVEQAEERWEAWRNKFEERWKKERDGWDSERERLRGVVREWEEASRRAVEEEEEREMNEQLSGDDLHEEEDEEAQEDVENGELLTVHNWRGSPPLDEEATALDTELSPTRVPVKPRRRRPSTKTTLAMRGLRAVVEGAGSSTPKAGPDSPAPISGSRGIRDPLGRVKSRRQKSSRPGTPTALGEKESSESGRESADTLRDEKDPHDRKLDHAAQRATSQNIPFAAVIIVAAVAGLLYYRHRE